MQKMEQMTCHRNNFGLNGLNNKKYADSWMSIKRKIFQFCSVIFANQFRDFWHCYAGFSAGCLLARNLNLVSFLLNWEFQNDVTKPIFWALRCNN